MFCSNCGAPVVEGNAFCTECGRRVEGPAAPVASTSGAGVGTVASGNAAAAPVPGKRSPVVPIVIAVLLVAGAGFMLWRSSGVSSSAPKSTVATTTSTPKSTVATTTAASSTSVTPPAGLRVETVDGAEWGVHSVKWYYDGAGNGTRWENYGVDGRLTLDSDGVAIYEWEYDSAGNVTREEYYGVDGRLVADSNGVAIVEREYDSAGNPTRQRRYDTQGRLVN